MEQSSISVETSTKSKERASMSSADDVLEMKSIVAELADRLVGKVKRSARIGAVAGAIGVGENRALEFLKGRARKVEAWEKENAARQRDRLRERERIERENAHLRWLECEIARQRASGSGFHGPHVDGLEHFLRLARGTDGTVAVPEAAAQRSEQQE